MACDELSWTTCPKIKEEAAHRKQLRETKKQLEKAVEDANKQKTAEDIIRETKEAAEKKRLDEAATEAAKIEAENKVRAERKAALNAKWSGSSTPSVTPTVSPR